MPKKWLERLNEVLASGETVEYSIAESRIGGEKLFSPAVVICTQKRVIITRMSPFRFHSSYKIINYKNIVETKLERGLIFSRIHFALRGSQVEEEEYRKWVSGLTRGEALELLHFVEKKRTEA